jgi:zinc protease
MKFLFLFLLLTNYAQAALNISQWQTPEGAKVLFTQTKGLPMLDVALNFDAASSKDGAQFGLAELTNTLIGTATDTLSEEQIINRFESLGTEFSIVSLKDMAIISMRSLTRADILRQSLSIFSDVVAQANFKQRYLSREKKQALRSIQAAKQAPEEVASLAFDELVFKNHAYAHAEIGTQNTLEAIQLSDVEQFYRQFYVAKNLTIALVGDISKTQARQIARQISHGLNMGQKAKTNPIVKPLEKSQVKHIEFPSNQTHLLIGQTGINRAHPDYYALYLGNHILGGAGLSSILGGEVREKKGLVYSVSSRLTKMKSHGFFLIELQTKNSQTQQAQKIALKVLDDFINNPISQQKLRDSKDNIIGGFALQTANNANILAYLSIIGFYNLPNDFLGAFPQKIEQISAKDIQQSFRRLIDMDKLIILSVGKSK